MNAAASRAVHDPRRFVDRHRYALLFFSLLLTVAIGPLLETMHFGRNAIFFGFGARPSRFAFSNSVRQ